MTKIEKSKQQYIVDNLRHVFAVVSKAARNEQRVTHDSAFCEHWMNILHELDLKRTYEEAKLKGYDNVN